MNLRQKFNKLGGTGWMCINSGNPQYMEIEELVKKNLVNGDTLDLEKSQIGDEGARALAQMEILAQVSRLELGDNEIGDDGVAALMASPHIRNVKILNLKSNQISGPGAQAIANSPHLGNLEQLILKFNKIGEEGARHLAASEHFPKLNTLDLFRNHMGDEGVAALKKSRYFKNLSRVRLDWIPVAEARHELICKMNLTREFPRSPKEQMADLVHIPRMADKARAARNNTLGEYIYPCPLDEIMLEFMGVDSETFQHRAGEDTAEALSAWVAAQCRHRSQEEKIAVNETLLNRQPDNPEKWNKFYEIRDRLDPTREDITTWVDLIDLEEGRN